jgi:hypothetical protein
MPKSIRVITTLSAIAMGACSVAGVRTTEEAPYEVLTKDGRMEVRQYESLIVAETIVDAEYQRSGNIAFRRLGGYIFGDNHQQQKVAMTTPVWQEPVDGNWTMTFVMPAEHTMQTLPEPTDPNVVLRTEPPRRVASIRYSGKMTEQRFHDHAEALQTWISEQGYEAISPPRSAAYDPPWTAPMMRRNEVHIDVR